MRWEETGRKVVLQIKIGLKGDVRREKRTKK